MKAETGFYDTGREFTDFINNVWKYIYEQGICKVVFSMADIGSVLNIFIYDGKTGLTIVIANAGTGQFRQNVTLLSLFIAADPVKQTTGVKSLPGKKMV